MNNISPQSYTPPNGRREPSHLKPETHEANKAETKETDAKATVIDAEPIEDQLATRKLAQVASLAKAVQTKVNSVPYIVPIAAGTAGFVLGVLASSKILRQLAFLAGSYALKETVKHAPKDELINFAKKLLVEAIDRQPA